MSVEIAHGGVVILSRGCVVIEYRVMLILSSRCYEIDYSRGPNPANHRDAFTCLHCYEPRDFQFSPRTMICTPRHCVAHVCGSEPDRLDGSVEQTVDLGCACKNAYQFEEQ